MDHLHTSKYLKSSLLSEDSCLRNYNHNPTHIPCYSYPPCLLLVKYETGHEENKPQPVQTDNNQHPLSGSLDNSTVIAVPAPAVTYVDMQELREPLLSEGGQES